LPEDLAFFKNGKCWLASIAHERMASIYDDSPQTKELLKSLGVPFRESIYGTAPKIEL